jgi:hypothetical protein
MSSADWTAVAALATAVAAGVTAWMAWMTRKMAVHAEAQAKTAADALEGAQRPIVVTSARTARLPYGSTDTATPTITQKDGKFMVPVQNVGPGPALNVVGVLMWNLVGEEDGKQYDVTTTMCAASHPLQLAPGAHADLEFNPLTREPISAPDALVRLWYMSVSGESYWTADRLSSHAPGYRSRTGRGDMPTDINESGSVPEPYAELLVKLRQEALAERFAPPIPVEPLDEPTEPEGEDKPQA